MTRDRTGAPMTGEASALRVTRIHTPEENALDGCRYAVTTPDGRQYVVAKEFYGAGPSLFTWVVTGGPGVEEWREFRTKRAALEYIASTPSTHAH